MTIWTSYFARIPKLPKSIVPISIARFPPTGYKGSRLSRLAPSPEILKQYKTTKDINFYTNEYRRAILSSLDPEKLYRFLYDRFNGRDVCLVCFEKAGDFCHRQIVSEWLRNAGIDSREWEPPCQQISLFQETENDG